ncbi:putative U box domain, armadillo-like helical, Zinc finger, RING/FYVE/PHD-type [Helianthus annuus]|uniref:RING-type E3 ubiquitin transferase n=1 Tax=Helianthus annuus TaxID=4232 RepID=A0A9K3H3E3_HELAN|nr:U-box domain-containing protein 40 [Helianthus annuus]KAF5765987.1 putative U box domain, armadillo-like helical, Zinc finger, RING/FYVE/PHD-type [Helianthus annuus]KAJ0452440.1 putative U box domain, armadillo-like helical, Zinc finger, RING/FYVE/PHD-type [Helianthus annuus]KAJ0474339.1 putative U box domain, armadillo-like helical, Zinc finger, RING/FYVE/PHD-type [Helianthus annuus]KAJ0649902.1 putative U box domain, armadillo-like helical, Zinc finger, RING/FYVE/PHD-type [Helianthus annuu
MGTSKHKWRFTLLRSPSHLKKPTPPPEFICPISNTLMADPVIVSSGQTFERNCVLACISLSFKPPTLPTLDFTTIIPNLALKSAIINWCKTHSYFPFPQPVDIRSGLSIVKTLINGSPDSPNCSNYREIRLSSLTSSASEDSVVAAACAHAAAATTAPIPFCYSSSSSSEIDNSNNNSNDVGEEDEDIFCKLRSGLNSDQEDAVVSLRNLTRTKQDARVQYCTPRVLSTLRHLIVSRCLSVQVNAVAALVNLSLEDVNKVKIVRSGIVPPLIDVLRGGFVEAQEHAAGALFSLALDDDNKTAIGVLGALPPLLHVLRVGSERCRHDSALALYHLSLVQSNRSKLVKLGSVQLFLNMVKSGHMTGRVMLVLCNLAGSVEGRAAMLDGGAVECLLGMLCRSEFDSESTRESCLGALYGLSQGGLRFKGLAKEAGAEELLTKEQEMGSERCKEKAGKILEVMMQKYEEEETVDWEALLNSDELTRSKFELVYGKGSV